MVTQKQRERIVREESARFLDENFAPLDLQGFPDLHNPQLERFEDADRHGFNRIDVSGLGSVNRLREMLENPSRQILEELARETRNPQLIQAITDERAADVAEQFVRRTPDYLRDDENLAALVDFLAQKHLRRSADEFNSIDAAVRELFRVNAWTLDELSKAYRQLLRQGALRVPANHPRLLTDRELAHSAQLAANGDVVGAVSTYLRHRVSEEIADQATYSLVVPEAFTTDPQYRPFIEEALLFVWENSHFDYRPTPERRRFLLDHVGGRFMTLALLDAAWKACKDAEKGALRSSLLTGTRDEKTDHEDIGTALEELDDAEINALYRRTTKHHLQNAGKKQRLYV